MYNKISNVLCTIVQPKYLSMQMSNFTREFGTALLLIYLLSSIRLIYRKILRW